MDAILKHYKSAMPIMLTPHATFEACHIMSDIQGSILPSSTAKLQRTEELFNNFADHAMIENALMTSREHHVNPRQFQYELLARAKAGQQHVVLPEGNEPRILQVIMEVLLV